MNYQNEFLKYSTQHLNLNEELVKKHTASYTSVPFYNFTPSIIEERNLNVAQMDVFSRLMMDRIIFLGVAIDDYVSNVIQAQLLFLESVDANRDIMMYINSPGGSITAGLGIYDTMQYIGPDVATICTGVSASMAAVLLCAGTATKRSCLPHSRVMIHQPSGGARGQLSDMEISYKLMTDMRKELYEIMAKHSNQSFDKIMADCDRDNWMTSKEAKEYGFVDEVLEKLVS